MDAASLFAFIGLLIKLALVIFEKVQKTPVEKRKSAMADFDAAISKAKESKDLGDLSKWFGNHS